MRRVTESAAHQPEWMAPEEVVRRVRQHYLEAVEWLHQVERDGRLVAHYLSGSMLVRAAQLLWTRASAPMFAGALRVDHSLEVRRFTESGERCLVVDHQTQRRMATYHMRTGIRAATQDLGSAIYVYGMVYDVGAARWKIDTFIQELPQGWATRRRTGFLVETAFLSPHDSSGRDS